MKYLRFLNPLIAPESGYGLLGRWQRWLYASAVVSLMLGLYWGLWVAPVDYQQGHSYRIIYVHVPTAFLAQSIYLLIATNCGVFLIWRVKFCDWVAEASAPIGAGVTLFAIASGAIWGKPTWGTYWVWDARLTSMLVLFLLYLALLSLRSALPRRDLAAKICAYTAIIGVVNIPIIKYSVDWWFTLHQGETLRLLGESSIDASMLQPLLLMIAACYLWYAACLCARLRLLLLRSSGKQAWVQRSFVSARADKSFASARADKDD